MAYSLGNVKPHVRAVANSVGPRFGIRTVYGYSYRNIAGTTTLSDHALGLALDFMCGKATGDKLAAYLRANAGALGITYVIWNRRIWSVARNGEGWRPYSGANPHTDHVHASFKGSGGNGTKPNAQNAGVDLTPWDGLVPEPDLTPWDGLLPGSKGGGIVPGVPDPGDIPDAFSDGKDAIGDVVSSLKSIASIVALLLQPSTWVRFFMFMVGLWMLAIGIGIAVKNTRAAAAVGSSVRTAAKAAAKAKVK